MAAEPHQIASRTTIPATAIARDGYGVLLRGTSGSGKSDLALRSVSVPITLPGDEQPMPFRLISDDQTELARANQDLLASPPTTLNGLLEVRGIGIVSLPFSSGVPVRLVVDLTSDAIERMPEYPGSSVMLMGLAIDLIQVSPFEVSAPLKIALALRRSIDERTLSA